METIIIIPVDRVVSSDESTSNELTQVEHKVLCLLKEDCKANIILIYNSSACKEVKSSLDYALQPNYPNVPVCCYLGSTSLKIVEILTDSGVREAKNIYVVTKLSTAKYAVQVALAIRDIAIFGNVMVR